MIRLPHWFGSSARPLFGWLHLPDDRVVRGCVVVCPPLGVEAHAARPAFAQLCDELSELGMAALRFDYEGTGDSAGHLNDPARLAAWTSSIGEAIHWMASQVHPRVTVVGMRMGALLAARAAGGREEVAGLVLWDPCNTGRAFLREQAMLAAANYGVTQRGDGSVEGPAYLFDAATARDIEGMELSSFALGEMGRVLLLERADAVAWVPPDGDAAVGQVERGAATGQRALLETLPHESVLPEEAIARITSWIAREATGSCVTADPALVTRAVVDSGATGEPVVEQAMWLGELPLFGVLAEPAGWTGGRTVVLLSAGLIEHTGPARMWVELARTWAMEGVRSVRVDASGVGDSPLRPSQPQKRAMDADKLLDIDEIARALGDPPGSELVLVGLSSGAYHALEAAFHLSPAALCLVNPAITADVREASAQRAARSALRPAPVVLRRLSMQHLRTSFLLWRLLLQVHLRAAPLSPVATVVRRGVPVLLLLDEGDARHFLGGLYWGMLRRALEKRGTLRVTVYPGTDHALYTSRGRERAMGVLSRFVLDHAMSRIGAGRG